MDGKSILKEGVNSPSPIKQPKALYLLFMVQMWECFSYYGMRSLLILYLIKELKYSDLKAFGVYTVYTALIEATGIIGGYLGDRLFGLKYSIYFGAIVITIGHLCMAVPGYSLCMYLGLALVVAGTGLFRTNCTALLGEFYYDNDPRRDQGFTLFYVGINVGGFLATIICAYLAEAYGWHYGFGVAGVGMMLGLIILVKAKSILKDKGLKPTTTNLMAPSAWYLLFVPLIAALIYMQDYIINYLPLAVIGGFIYCLTRYKDITKAQKQGILTLLIAIMLLALFYAFEELLGTLLVTFSERNVDRNMIGKVIPAPSLISINPLTIMLVGPLLTRLLQRNQNNKKISEFFKISISFLLLAVAFAILAISCYYSNNYNLVNIVYVITAFALIAVAELFVGPTVYCMSSILAPENFKGTTMGMVILGYSLANILSGLLSKILVVEESNNSLLLYQTAFITISGCCLGIALLINVVKGVYGRDKI